MYTANIDFVSYFDKLIEKTNLSPPEKKHHLVTMMNFFFGWKFHSNFLPFTSVVSLKRSKKKWEFQEWKKWTKKKKKKWISNTQTYLSLFNTICQSQFFCCCCCQTIVKVEKNSHLNFNIMLVLNHSFHL